jgi:hypothetical protein
VILAQLEGSGRGALGAYNAGAYELLSGRLLEGGAGAISRDPDAWVEGLMERDPALGGRGRGVLEGEGRGTRAAETHPTPPLPSTPCRRPRRRPPAALRVLEVRDAYCSENFEWDQLQRLAAKDTKNANLRLMRKAAAASLAAGVGGAGAGAGGEGGEGAGGGGGGGGGSGPAV